MARARFRLARPDEVARETSPIVEGFFKFLLRLRFGSSKVPIRVLRVIEVELEGEGYTRSIIYENVERQRFFRSSFQGGPMVWKEWLDLKDAKDAISTLHSWMPIALDRQWEQCPDNIEAAFVPAVDARREMFDHMDSILLKTQGTSLAVLRDQANQNTSVLPKREILPMSEEDLRELREEVLRKASADDVRWETVEPVKNCECQALVIDGRAQHLTEPFGKREPRLGLRS